jgi:hypothetical protein
MDRDPIEHQESIFNDSDQTFVELLVKFYITNQSRYEEQARQLLKEHLLHVAKGNVVIRYWIDEKGSYFKFSEDSGVTFSNSLSFFPLSGTDEEKIQDLRDQFANSEARLALKF